MVPKLIAERSSAIVSVEAMSAETVLSAEAVAPGGGGGGGGEGGGGGGGGGGSLEHEFWPEAELRGAGASVAKSTSFASVSVQPLPARKSAVVLESPGAGPEPS